MDSGRLNASAKEARGKNLLDEVEKLPEEDKVELHHQIMF